MEWIQKNVEKEVGDRIRSYGLAGVKVDEDYRRYYPYGSMASKVLGFTGGDNQGIIGLEVEYESILEGIPGEILALTDARGIELTGVGESRRDPVAGKDLVISLDYNIQQYAEQAARQVMEKKQADSVSILIMNPKNGEIYAMTNMPEFDLNEPFTLLPEYTGITEMQDALNQMWRNGCINDTYEPGSTFKIITASAGLEEGVVTLDDTFSCPGYRIVEDRRIRCHKVGGHGAETFLQATRNSCNPVFIDVGSAARCGSLLFCIFSSLGCSKKTGIDLPGEAATIMHKKENDRAGGAGDRSRSGSRFRSRLMQLIATVSSLINGGTRVTPHFGRAVRADASGAAHTDVFLSEWGEDLSQSRRQRDLKRYALEQVVADGGVRKKRRTSRGTGSAARPRRLRTLATECRINTSHPLSDSHRRTIRRSSRCVSSIIRRGCTTADLSRLRS